MTVKKKEKSAHFRGKHFFLIYFFKAAEQLFLPTTGDGMVADGSVGSGSRFKGFPTAWLKSITFCPVVGSSIHAVLVFRLSC